MEKTRRDDKRVGKETYILLVGGGAALVFSMTWSVLRMLLASAMWRALILFRTTGALLGSWRFSVVVKSHGDH